MAATVLYLLSDVSPFSAPNVPGSKQSSDTEGPPTKDNSTDFLPRVLSTLERQSFSPGIAATNFVSVTSGTLAANGKYASRYVFVYDFTTTAKIPDCDLTFTLGIQHSGVAFQLKHYVYIWRPGTGVVATIYGSGGAGILDSATTSTTTLTSYVKTVACTGASVLAGDKLIYEMWGLSPAGGSGPFSWKFGYDGPGRYFTAGVTIPYGNWIASSLSFAYPIGFGTISLAEATPNTTESNKLNVSFNSSVQLVNSNGSQFSLSPSVPIIKSVEPDEVRDAHAESGQNFNLICGTELPTDGSTHAHWKLAESPPTTTTASDATGTYNLTAESTTPVSLYNGLAGFGRSFGGLGSFQLTTASIRTTLLGEWTLDILFKLTSFPTTFATLFGYSGTTGETQAENTVASVRVDLNGQPDIYWENGAGVDVNFNPKVFFSLNKMYFLSVRKKLISGSNYQVDLYVDGQKVATSGALGNADGGTSGSMQIRIGRRPNSSTEPFVGVVGPIRLSNVARTDAAISAYATALVRPFTGDTLYTLTGSGTIQFGSDIFLEYLGSPGNTVKFKYYGQDGLNSNGNAVLAAVQSRPTTIQALKAFPDLTATHTVVVRFTNPLQAHTATSVAGNYAITGPSAITVASVAFTPGTSQVTLTTTGNFVSGTYTLAIADNTVVDTSGQSSVNNSTFIVSVSNSGGAKFNTGLN